MKLHKEYLDYLHIKRTEMWNVSLFFTKIKRLIVFGDVHIRQISRICFVNRAPYKANRRGPQLWLILSVLFSTSQIYLTSFVPHFRCFLTWNILLWCHWHANKTASASARPLKGNVSRDWSVQKWIRYTSSMKAVPHDSLTLPFEPFQIRIYGDIRNQKRLSDSPSGRVS
jgi:hypothetical protein